MKRNWVAHPTSPSTSTPLASSVVKTRKGVRSEPRVDVELEKAQNPSGQWNWVEGAASSWVG
ncbi:MAG TPA: hypothetical protein VGA56_15210 [Opitutaceae bacterium]